MQRYVACGTSRKVCVYVFVVVVCLEYSQELLSCMFLLIRLFDFSNDDLCLLIWFISRFDIECHM